MTSIYAVTEDELQKQVVQWLHVALPPGCVFHHSPNEGRRHVAFKRKLKQMGTQYGWPDLEIFVPGDQSKHGISTSIFIELKRMKGGKLNANQEEMKARLLLAGCHWGLARSVEQVHEILEPLVKLKAGV
jgi:hypothetical protein